MILIHSYFPSYVQKLFQYGIARKGDGFKINQTFRAPEEKRFNVLAREGGEFFEFIKENASCFYVDRLQGGVFYFKYDFDRALMDTYAQKTDAEFLGLQLHEIGSTRRMDWERIQKCLAADGLAWTEENIYESVKKISVNKEYPHFSQASAKEYAALTPPKTLTEFADDVDALIQKRQAENGGHVFTCDASTILCRNEAANGIRTAFIEVGGQTAHTRAQFALRRGLSRAAGNKWGVYIEPWGGQEYTAYRMTTDGSNDWYSPTDNKKLLYKVYGENGGSSMSLAKRLMFYSLFAGAHYFAEEWGAGNTFYDWQDGGLTPYGLHKQKMAHLAAQLKNVTASVPIAILLPKEYRVVRVHGKPLGYENDITDGDYNDIMHRIHKLFYNGESRGFEDNILTTGRYGSLFDVIYEDSYEHPENEYALLIDFAGTRFPNTPRTVDGYDEENLFRTLDSFVEEFLPFTMTATEDADYTLFENNGERYCCLFNHCGISKSIETGETANPEATITVQLTMKTGKISEVFDLYNEGFAAHGNTLQATLQPGCFLLFRYES